ncbi:MAG TPA: hypothetical protein VEK08_12595 [Planctomycetota bacterium]|nr:hypothetical protein [Planctomycetota bacterium]
MSEFAQFNGMIGPENLIGLVRNTAPFLFTLKRPLPSTQRLILMGADPLGFVDILQNAGLLQASDNPTTGQREDYFALCIAAHHATVATFIPTDVDAKIRGTLWQQREDPMALRRMFDLALQWLKWDISGISTRATELSGVGPVSGHNGEMLGVLAGALGGFLKIGDSEYAQKAADAIDEELKREAHEFRFVMGRKGREIDLLKLSSSLTHNCGDLDQGISFWSNRDIYEPYRARFHRLAHENTSPYDGTFQIAAKLYRKIMSSEGHRHYPLRAVRALRTSPDFLLPLGPFLDDWGTTLARHGKLTTDDKAEVLGALLSGCKKIKGQLGYYRAISGFFNALSAKQLEEIIRRMPASLRQETKDPEIRRHIALQKISFESGMRKRCLAEL